MLKIKYFYDDDKNVTGCKAVDAEMKFFAEFTTKRSGGLWVNGMQTIGHCDFYLTGGTANQRKQMRNAVLNSFEYGSAKQNAGIFD